MPDQQLIIDRASSAVQLADDEVRTWAATQRVFVSSVIEGMERESEAAVDAITEVGAEPVWFEGMGGRDQDAEQAYLAEVAASDTYVGILGSRYGRPDPNSGYSATHAEYLHAVDRGLRISVWNMDVDDMAGHQRDFLDEVRTYFVTGTVNRAQQLGEKVAARLKLIAAEDLAPWCMVGQVVFRASEISDDGQTISVSASVRDPDVAHALTALRPGGFMQSPTVRVVFGDTAATASVSSVEVTERAGATRHFSLVFRREHGSGARNLMNEVSYSVNGRSYSPNDLTEIAVRRTLFNEPAPFDHDLGFTEMDNPVEPLRRAGLSEESLRPILRLLLVDDLVGSGRASRITKLLVGPKTSGKRRILLEWEPPARYGERQGRRHAEGDTFL